MNTSGNTRGNARNDRWSKITIARTTSNIRIHPSTILHLELTKHFEVEQLIVKCFPYPGARSFIIIFDTRAETISTAKKLDLHDLEKSVPKLTPLLERCALLDLAVRSGGHTKESYPFATLSDTNSRPLCMLSIDLYQVDRQRGFEIIYNKARYLREFHHNLPRRLASSNLMILLTRADSPCVIRSFGQTSKNQEKTILYTDTCCTRPFNEIEQQLFGT